MPHGHCYMWKPEVLWTNLMGDALTALSYFMIPFVLIYFNRKRRESVIAPVLWLFGAFIFFCGTSHIIDIITIWVPSYRLEALIKIITGVVSLITAIYLIRILPTALRIPSPMQLEEANIELNKFAYTVAHDLRSPMRQIMGYARLLESREDQSISPQGKVYLQNIVSISKDIGGMVDELLEYTKTQKSESVRVNINTQVLVKKLIEELELSTDQDIDWQVGNLPDIKADEVMVKAVFRNLLENALKYSRNKLKSIIILTGKKVGNKVHFKLRDNGVGFDMSYYHKLF